MSILLAALFLFQDSSAEAPQPAAIAFVGVQVLPMTDERVLRDQTVLVEGGRIARLGPVAEVPLAPDVLRIEGRGRILMPGLADSHAHVFDEGDLLVYVANGVTTIRNLEGVPWHLELRERIARGEILGPRVVTAGPFVNVPQVRTIEDAQRCVAEQFEAGYDCIKIHGDLPPETYAALLEEAAMAELPVVGHVPRNLPIERVFELRGQIEISHAEEYLYTYFDRLPGGPTAESIEKVARATAEAGVTVTPNLVVFDIIVRQIQDLDRELARAEVAWVAPPGRRSWKRDLNRYARDFEPEDAASLAQRFVLLERLTKALQAAGVPLLAGTDAMNPVVVPGFSMHDELAHLVAAGLTPYQALRAATASFGEFVGDGSGRVAEGAPADLVLLAGNPLESIAHTRAIEGVLVAGHWFAKGELAQRMKALADEYRREEAFMGRTTIAGLDEALSWLREARAKDPRAFVFRPEALESLAVLFGMVGNPTAARRAAELAVAEHPGRWTSWTRLAEACQALDDGSAARAALQKALELRPGDARILRSLEVLADER